MRCLAGLTVSPAADAAEATVRQWVVSNPKTPNLPEQTVNGLTGFLFNGILNQLRSIPVGLRVDSWILAEFPDLAELQQQALTKRLEERVVDLLEPFRSIHYPHPAQGGSAPTPRANSRDARERLADKPRDRSHSSFLDDQGWDGPGGVGQGACARATDPRLPRRAGRTAEEGLCASCLTPGGIPANSSSEDDG
jgi:hypothetical protein